MSYLRHSLLIACESNQSMSYAANFSSDFLYFVFSKWSVSSTKNLFLMFEFVEDRDDAFDVVDIDDGGVVDSFFLSFAYFDDTDNNFDTTDIGEGDDDDK